LTLRLNSFKCIEHPYYKKEVCGADAQGELNWGVYGMKYSEFGQGDAGRVTLRIQVEGMRKDD
jgi:polyisoprenoid-binding protein YceI